MSEQADVVVVGLGPGGEEVAEELAAGGLEVLGVDGGLVGGECPYWGCVPSKGMVRAANALAEARRAQELAGRVTVVADWAKVARRVRELTANWDDSEAVERLQRKGGRFVRGVAHVVGPRAVVVDGQRIEARKALVLAPGSRPSLPPVPGLESCPHWSNREAIETLELPASLVVLGGGAVGLELAQVMARFSVPVTVVEAAPRLLSGEEPEASSLLSEVLASEGLRLVTGARVTGASAAPEGITLALADGSTVAGQRLLVATGRRPDLAALGVGVLGVDEQAARLAVDERLRVLDDRGVVVEGVYAVGDVTGKGAFTHMAVYQGRIVAAELLGRPVAPARYDAIPRVTFTDPEVGAVGLTEAEALARGLDVVAGTADLSESARGWIHKVGNRGLIKVVLDRRRRVLVGATSIGPAGGEVLSMLTLAVHAALEVEELRSMIYAYPTFHRAIEAAVGALPGS